MVTIVVFGAFLRHRIKSTMALKELSNTIKQREAMIKDLISSGYLFSAPCSWYGKSTLMFVLLLGTSAQVSNVD